MGKGGKREVRETKEEGIKETVEWYLQHQEWIQDIETGKYKEAYMK